MRIAMALGAVVWVLIVAWLVRLGLGQEHLSQAQLLPGIAGGIGGGFAGWYYVKWLAKQGAFRRKED